MAKLFGRRHYKFMIESVLYGPRLADDHKTRINVMLAMVEAFSEDPEFNRDKFLEYCDAMEHWPKSKPQPSRVRLGPPAKSAYPAIPANFKRT